MTNFQELFIWGLGVVISLGAAITGWVFNMVFASIKEVENNANQIAKSLADHKLHTSETFATKQDFKDGFDRVMNKLDNIDQKLDRKMDKISK